MSEKILKKILPFFSYLFHPIFVPSIGTVFYILYSDRFYSIQQAYLLLFQVIIITLFLSLSFFYLLKTFGKVDNLMLSDASQRKIPLLMQIALTTILISRSISIDKLPELFYFFLGAIISTVFAFVLLFYNCKASLHMIALGALSFFVISMGWCYQLSITFIIASLFFITGLVGSSRLQMRAHSIRELAIGYFLGLLPQLLLWKFWL